MTIWSDPFAFDTGRPSMYANFGGEPRSLVQAQTTNSLNSRPAATFTLDFAVEPPLDYLAELTIVAGSPDEPEKQRPLFTGFVDTAEPAGTSAHVTAAGATELAERSTGLLKTAGVPPQELVHLLARGAGYGTDQLKITGLADLPREIFQVMVPVAGVTADWPLIVGGVRFLPVGDAPRSGVTAAEQFRFMDLEPFTAVAVTMYSTSSMFDAEGAGLARIDSVLNGMLTSTLYGLSARPEGTSLPFARTVVRARPRRLDTVQVYGLSTDRTWTRSLTSSGIAATVLSSVLLERWPSLLVGAPPAELRDALAALRRAADEAQSPVQRGQAVWDTVEFLVAGVSVPKIFAKADRKKIRQALARVSLAQRQQERLDEVLANLNSPSLMQKLRQRVRDDAVPMSAAEFALLFRLREARNDAAHGRQTAPVSGQDLRWAVSVVARIAMYRWHRLSTVT